MRDLLYHGQHLTASAVYGRELYAGQDVASYFFFLVVFPIVGLVLSTAGAGLANVIGTQPDSGGPPRRPGDGGPEPLPHPPDGGRRADVNELLTLGGG
jgi:hypothetical protein